MIFETRLQRDFLETHLSKLSKKTYNQFIWWRRYQQRQTLHDKRTLYEKIVNGDYEHSDYYYQAEHENYLLEDVTEHLKAYEDRQKLINANVNNPGYGPGMKNGGIIFRERLTDTLFHVKCLDFGLFKGKGEFFVFI